MPTKGRTDDRVYPGHFLEVREVDPRWQLLLQISMPLDHVTQAYIAVSKRVCCTMMSCAHHAACATTTAPHRPQYAPQGLCVQVLGPIDGGPCALPVHVPFQPQVYLPSTQPKACWILRKYFNELVTFECITFKCPCHLILVV